MKTTSPLAMVSLTARLCSLLAVLLTVTASAVDLTTQKVYGKWALTPTGYHLGESDLEVGRTTALSPKWIVVGATAAAERGLAFEGAVQVFNAATGAWVRKLLPPLPAAGNRRFGCSVAIAGDLAVIGAYSSARAYIYNLATGALVRTLNADAAHGGLFAFNVATNGVVAAIADHGNLNYRGAVYLYNVATGAEIETLTAFDGANDHFYAYSMALEGNILAVGADGADGNRGAVYFYDLSKPVGSKFIKKLQPASWVAGNHMGAAVAMHQGRVVIGNFVFGPGKAHLHDLATNLDTALTVGGTGTSFGEAVAISGPIIAVSEQDAGRGRVHLFRSSDGVFIRTILPPNGDTNPQRFGHNLALDGTALLVTAPLDSAQANEAGAAHLIGPLTQPMSFTKVVAKGDFAPGAPDISYGTLGDAFTNATQAVTFTSTLTGSNSNAGKDYGVFSDIKTANSQELLFKSRQLYSGTAVFGVPSAVSSNDYELAIGLSTLTGAGVSSLNNQLLWAKTDTAQLTLIRTGTAFGVGSPAVLLGTTPQSIIAPVTALEWLQKGMGAICTLRVGLGGVAATDDSALYLNKVGTSIEALRESSAAPAPLVAGVNLGQFAPRLAVHFNRYVYSTALTGTGITAVNNAAIFNKQHGVAPTLVAQKNDQAVNETGGLLDGGSVRYSAFIGESCPSDYGEMYRATLSGAPTTNNEGIWSLDSAGARRLAFRKGQTLTALPGLKIAKVVTFWASGASFGDVHCIALVQLSGTGVSAANDQALLDWHSDGTLNVLMREGDPASGCPGAKIGVISRVESNAYSRGYAVLVTLTGATPSSDQALYTGNLSRGNTTTQVALRRPFLRLRKGQLFDNQPGKVKSISLPTGNITTGGAGSTGRGHAISATQDFVFVAEFDNGVRQIMKGKAD